MAAGLAMQRDAAPAFRIGPLTTYADPAAMRAWLEAAGPGDEMIYASGPVCGAHPAQACAAAMEADGEVELFQRRSGRPNCFDYTARKTGGEARPKRNPRGAKRPDTLRAQLGHLLRVLREAAEHGAPCPSNAALAKAIGLGRGEAGRRRARYLLQRLTDEQRIAVRGQGRNAPRVITILAAGKAKGRSTGTSAGAGT